MDERAFIDGSKHAWDRLARAVAVARRQSVARLGATELREMHEDYRRAAADLAYAQTHFPSSRTAAYLNRLVGDAHAEIYGGAPRRRAAIVGFFARGFPQLVRRRRRALALATGLLLGATALGFVLAYVNYPLARVFIPAALRDSVSDSIEQGGDVSTIAGSLAPVLSAAVMVNNIQVSLLAFAGGMTFGALTAYAVLVNGLMLGALAGVFHKAGAALPFWTLVIPHGALELPAMALAAAAGFVLAGALLSPGDLPRTEALKLASPDALRLVLGAAALLVVAGLIEGFITPAPFDPALKIAFGLLVFMALGAYLTLAGRREAVRSQP